MVHAARAERHRCDGPALRPLARLESHDTTRSAAVGPVTRAVGRPQPTLLPRGARPPMTDPTIHCRRCDKDAAPLAKAPFRSELGERVLAEICGACWQDWLQHQTLLINHYGLDPRDRRARDFLYEQIEQVLFDGERGREIDTSQQGSIEW